MSSPYLDGRYGARNPTWHEEDAPHKVRALARAIRATELRPATVVEVGCGTGAVLAGLKAALPELEADYQGWDIAPEAIDRARSREAPGLSFRRGEWAREGQPADLVLAVDVMEHLADDVGFLAALAARAEHLLLRIPLDLSAWDALRPRRMLAARRDWGHLHAYNRALALERLHEAGVEDFWESYDRVPPQIPHLSGRLVDGLRRALVRVAPHEGVALLGGYSLVVVARGRPGATR